MDIAMPELNGLDATARIARSDCACPVLILSMHATEQYVLEALRNGASGYVLKDADADELERAIRCVVRGEKYLTPAVSKHLLDDYMRRIRSDEAQESSATRTLTARQREILQLVAEGKSTREIAELLHLSVKTVETHRAQIMQRLEIYDVAGLTRYAIRTGIISG
jgi:DNA-binding NarL/FixJ family response regulator